MILRLHPIRALAPALAALLLALVPVLGTAAPLQGAPPAPGAVAPGAAVPDAAPPAAALPTPAPPATTSAVIHPGDQLAITVYPDNSLTQTVIVQNDGTIQFPLVKRVLVAGQSAAEASDTLSRALAKYVRNPHVTLSVVQQGQMNVLVMGNVKNSGKFQMRSGAHVSDALAAAGFVANINGDYPMVNVLQPNGVVQHANLQKLLRGGDASENVELGDNAIVYVLGGETIRVQVLGAVTRPGNVEVNVGDRMSMALARAGVEAAARPDLSRVSLSRRDPATGKTLATYTFNAYPGLQGGDQRYDPIMQKDDLIFIPEARQVSPALIGILGLFGRLIGI